MKKIEWPLIKGPRTITMQNSKQSFRDFLRLVQSVVNGQRLFVSKQIFAEVWDDCVARGGKITPPIAKKDFLIYAFTSGRVEEKNSLCFVFFVHPNKKQNQQIQLVKAAGCGLNFQSTYNGISEKYYFQRAPEKKHNFEK